MQKYGVLWLVLGFGLLAGCDNNQEFGRVAGGIAGAGIGNRLGSGSNRAFTTVVGAIVGSSLGERIGRDMDERNRERLAQVLENSKINVELKQSRKLSPGNFRFYIYTSQIASFNTTHKIKVLCLHDCNLGW